MVIQAEPIEFDDDDPRPLLKHLDQWAAIALANPRDWADMVQRAGQWADYSARNQVLLASYNIVGPVAGASTWSQVPSVDNARECAVRAGEHSLPVRVPITSDAQVASGRTAGSGFSGSVAKEFRWEPVFAAEQLARRPHPDVMTSTAVPTMSGADWAETVRKASTEIMGRRPRGIPSAQAQLSVLAARVPLGRSRHALPPGLVDQAGWLVADRVGHAVGPIPGFDPSGMKPRERWQRLEDVRNATGRVSRAVSNVLDVDLAASPLPRWAVSDDRDVQPGRRNYLSRSDVAGLPAGLWSEVGPYSQPEWESRGRPGVVGRAAFMKATERSYLAVYETSGGARWSLETAGRGRHLGLITEGTADTIVAAKADARSALRDRYPDVARSVDETVGAPVLSPGSGWVSLQDGRDERTLHRTFTDRVAVVVAPGPGGRWGVWTNVDGEIAQVPQLVTNQNDGKDLAEGVARGLMMGHAAVNPARANAMLVEAASVPDRWDRQILVELVGPGLVPAYAARLGSNDLDAGELVELLADSGRVGAATILQVLHVEQVDAPTAASLVPDIGIPVPEAVNTISRTWNLSRLDAGDLVGATREDMKAAGATLSELLAHAPVETLRTLDTRPQTWDRLGPALMESGMDAVAALRLVADHAPNPAALAVAVESITDNADSMSGHDPLTAALTVIGRRVDPESLAAMTERFGLDPHQSAAVMSRVNVPTAELVQAVIVRTDGDPDVARGVLAESIGMDGALFDAAIVPEANNVLEFRARDGSSVNKDLLAALAPATELPQASASRGSPNADLLDSLSEPKSATQGRSVAADLERAGAGVNREQER